MVASLFVVTISKSIINKTVSQYEFIESEITPACQFDPKLLHFGWRWLGSFLKSQYSPTMNLPWCCPCQWGRNMFKWFGCIIRQRSGLLVWSLASGAQEPSVDQFFFFFWLQFFVCFKWPYKRNSLTTHFGHDDLHLSQICTHYLARVYSKLTLGHFLQTFTSFRKWYFRRPCIWLKSFLDGTVFALAFFELWEWTWHPVSHT